MYLGKNCPCLNQIAKAEAGQQQCCPASVLTCPSAHPPYLLPLFAPLSSGLHPLVACPSASAVPMFPASPPSYLLLPPPPACLLLSRPTLLLPPALSHPAVAARVVPYFLVPLGPDPSVAVVLTKETITVRRRKEESRKKHTNRRHTCPACLPPRPVRRYDRHLCWSVPSCPPIVMIH